MASILPDREIRVLIGPVLINAEADLINPNGIELRLGAHVRFHSTGEEKELTPGCFLQVSPGETVVISSLEAIDFTPETVRAVVTGGKMLMGFVTPTTTMMREGISQVATKIDAGFKGILNWGLRNGSVKTLTLEYGEPIFKLTIFALDADESPDIAYGQRDRDSYQNTWGIARSARRIPADIPKAKIVSSSFAQLDPKKQLQQAGYPFDHIGTELMALHGKFELVSVDVRVMKEEFTQRTAELANKIEKETTTLSTKIEDAKNTLLDRADILFDRKFFRSTGIVIGAIPVLYGVVSFLRSRAVGDDIIAWVALFSGLVIWILSFTVKSKR
jgi:deoxycytidine triphosphate deaminase